MLKLYELCWWRTWSYNIDSSFEGHCNLHLVDRLVHSEEWSTDEKCETQAASHFILTLNVHYLLYNFSELRWNLTSSSAIAERRAAGCVSFGQKSKTGTAGRHLTNITGLSSTTVTQSACKAIEFGEKTQDKGYYTVIQGHLSLSFWHSNALVLTTRQIETV